jgi:ABC-type siderophore export system fused ATPase/permease subunit
MIQNVRESVFLWPITTVYLTGVGVILLISADIFAVVVGIMTFGLLTLLILLLLVWKELRTVHELDDAMVVRIDQLIETLHSSDDQNPKAGTR